MSEFEKFTISQVAVWIKDRKVLLLEDAAHPGKWIIPGGRIDQGEPWEEAFARELLEELSLNSFETVALLDVDVWYWGEANQPQSAVARLISSDQEEIQISSEHLQMRWFFEGELSDEMFVWPNGLRMCKKGFEKKKEGE